MFQIRRSLEFWHPTVVFKHRWRWKPVAANDDASEYKELQYRRFIVYAFAALDMEGHDPDELPHRAACRATTLLFHSDVITRLELMLFLGGPRLTSFPGASGRITLNRLELMLFLEVHVVRHFWEPLEGSRSTIWSVGLGRFWSSTWQELEQMKYWIVLPFGRQSFIDAHMLQGSGLSNWLDLCFG
jgi:hypothetical protein